QQLCNAGIHLTHEGADAHRADNKPPVGREACEHPRRRRLAAPQNGFANGGDRCRSRNRIVHGAQYQSTAADLQCRSPRGHSMNQPWLTTSDCPVSALLSKLAKNSAVSATSTTVVNSPSTVSFSITFLITDLDAGIAHQHVDPFDLLHGAGDVVIDLALIGDVHRHAQRLAGAAELGRVASEACWFRS